MNQDRMNEDEWEPSALGSSMDLNALVAIIGAALSGKSLNFYETIGFLHAYPENVRSDIFDYIVAKTAETDLPTKAELDILVQHVRKKLK